MKLSVVLSVFNEEKLLKECLESVTFADEIIVVDNSSTDKTKEIAQKYTSKVFTQPNDPQKIDLQKNTGFEKASGEWILSLDADERVSEELQKEIRQTIEKNEKEVSGYWIPRDNVIFGKVIKHGLWTDDYQLRLFRKGTGRFEKATVHKPLTLIGQSEKLTRPLLHINYTSVDQYLQKMIFIYTENEAQRKVDDGEVFSWKNALLWPGRDFIKTFLAQKGYKDGIHGLVLSLLQAFYTFIVFVKVWEKQGFPSPSLSGFFEEVISLFKLLVKEGTYWIYTEKGTQVSSQVKKNVYKVLRKLSQR